MAQAASVGLGPDNSGYFYWVRYFSLFFSFTLGLFGAVQCKCSAAHKVWMAGQLLEATTCCVVGFLFRFPFQLGAVAGGPKGFCGSAGERLGLWMEPGQVPPAVPEST